MLTIAVDFDLTLVEAGEPLRWRAGAKEGLVGLARTGHRLVLHSCRCTPHEPDLDRGREDAEFWRWGTPPPSVVRSWDGFGAMRDFLVGEGVWDLFRDVWQSPGKPRADIYLDDRYEAPEWQRIILELASGGR